MGLFFGAMWDGDIYYQLSTGQKIRLSLSIQVDLQFWHRRGTQFGPLVGQHPLTERVNGSSAYKIPEMAKVTPHPHLHDEMGRNSNSCTAIVCFKFRDAVFSRQ